MSGQHAPFEEESRGEPSTQIGYGDVPGQKLQAGSLGTATSTTHYLDRVRAVLALLSLIFGSVLVLVVIPRDAPRDKLKQTKKAGALANTGLRGFVAEREFSPRSVSNSNPKQAFDSLDKISNMRYCFIYGKYPLRSYLH